MISKFKNQYNKSLFKPTLFGLFFNPFFIIRKGLYRSVNANKHHMHGKLLDLGCGSKPYKDLFQVDQYIGVDIEVSGHDHTNENIDVFYDGKTIPFDDNTFDSVFSSETFEHIFNLSEILDEIKRVLKPGGKLMITIPFVWDEHEIPYDFARYTTYGLTHILEEKGFKIHVKTKTTYYVETIFQMSTAYLFQHVFPKNKILRITLTPLFITPIHLSGMLLNAIFPKNQSFYHNNVFVLENLK